MSNTKITQSNYRHNLSIFQIIHEHSLSDLLVKLPSVVKVSRNQKSLTSVRPKYSFFKFIILKGECFSKFSIRHLEEYKSKTLIFETSVYFSSRRYSPKRQFRSLSNSRLGRTRLHTSIADRRLADILHETKTND